MANCEATAASKKQMTSGEIFPSSFIFFLSFRRRTRSLFASLFGSHGASFRIAAFVPGAGDVAVSASRLRAQLR